MSQPIPYIRQIFCLIVLFSAGIGDAVGGNQNTRPVDSAYHYMTEGVRLYGSGVYERAEGSFHAAIRLILEKEKPDSSRLAYSYLNLGAIRLSLWDDRGAIEYFNNAGILFRGLYGDKHYLYASVLINLGNVYFNSRDLKRAEDYYKQALAVLNSYQPRESVISQVAILNNNLGLLFEQQGNFDLALSYFEESVKIRQLSGLSGLISTLSNKADCLRRMGRYREAEQIHLQNIREATRLHGENHVSLGLVYIYYGFLLESGMKQYDKAMDAYQKAFRIMTANFGDKHPYVSNVHLNIGKLHLATDNPGAAAESFQRALIALVPGFNETNPQSNPNLDEVPSLTEFLETLKEKGRTFEKIAEKNRETWPLVISMNTYELATEAIDRMRLGYQSEESRLFLSANQNTIFHDAIRVCYKLAKVTGDKNYLEKALFFAGKNKAANLLSSIRELGAREFGRIPSSLLEKETDLKRKIALYTEYIYEEGRLTEPDQEKLALWQQLLFQLNSDYKDLVNVLEESYPYYYRLKYDTSVAGLEKIRRSLGRKDALIEYSLSDSTIYIFYITRNEFEVIEKKTDKDFRKDVDNILEIFDNKRFSYGVMQDYLSFINSAHRLYVQLIYPLENWPSGQNLIIVPDGILAYLPFELLISEKPSRSEPNYSGLAYLLRNHAISYAHSTTLLTEYKETASKRGGRVMAFAPRYESDGILIPDLLNSRSRYRDNLKPLPASREEVKNILRLVGGKLWLDDEATENNFKKYAPEYNILHLAMHTLIDDLNPMFSKLVFTQVKDSINDGLLNTFEIYNLSLNASMAVLSSCKSGWGKFQTGEGVLSLARGFLYAGVPSIVMTLWEIEDQSSAEVMTLFYIYLKKGKSKNEALRLAKLEFLDNADMLKSHPYFWGGYVAIGDTCPVFYNRVAMILLLAGLIIIAFASFCFYKRRRRF